MDDRRLQQWRDNLVRASEFLQSVAKVMVMVSTEIDVLARARAERQGRVIEVPARRFTGEY